MTGVQTCALPISGETITVSGGATNATLTVTANATGNIGSVAISNGGYGFVNTSSLTYTFNRQKPLAAESGGNTGGITYTGTATGYSNSDYIVVSNVNALVNATANVSTNATGGALSITISKGGLFPATQTNTGLVVTVYAANGAASNEIGRAHV